MPAPQYPYDPTGVNPLNRITNEKRTITVSNGINGFLIKPAAAPFFGDSLVIVNSNGDPLSEGTHYYLTHPWKIGSDQVGRNLYGSITMVAGYPIDTYTIVYRTIGGGYINNSDVVIEDALTASASDYLTVDWSTAPTYFPSAPHTHDIDSTFQMIEYYHALMAIANAIRSNDGHIHIDDIIDLTPFWMQNNLNTSLQLIESIAQNNNATGALLTQLLNDTAGLRNNGNIPIGLKNITLNLGGGFKLKTGALVIPNTVTAGTIRFPKPYFTDQCFSLTGAISLTVPATGIVRDKLYFDLPTTDNVTFEIDYAGPLVAGDRIIKYTAIGK